MAVEEMAELVAELSEFVYQETNDPDEADRQRFYKVERWDSAEQYVVELLYASNDLSKAKAMLPPGRTVGRAGATPCARVSAYSIVGRLIRSSRRSVRTDNHWRRNVA
jgi:hypothetical protein